MKSIDATARIGALAAAVLALGAAAGCEGSLQPEPPAKTVRVVTGSVELVGSGLGTCSHGMRGEQPSGPRWCAFARRQAGGNTELWAVNVSRALSQGRPLTCDGTSADCVLLSSTLWDKQPLFQVGHPYIHNFGGDTLTFYASSRTPGADDGYEGPVQGWRPGMPAPRVLTGDKGFTCSGHLRSDGVICLENQTGIGNALEFDLLAGPLGAGTGPLPRLRRIKPYGSRRSPIWQVSFSPSGAELLLSSQAPDLAVERLEIVGTADVGRADPRELMRNLSRWEISPDGSKIFYLSGYVPVPDGDGRGTLTMADFPSMGNPVQLAPRVSGYEIFPERPEGGPARGVGILSDVVDGGGTFQMLADLARPTALVTVAEGVRDPQVSPDLRYSVFDGVSASGDIVTYLAHNGGAGQCALTDPGVSAFGVTFAGATRQVFWLQDAPGETGKFQAWVADPEGCGGRRPFAEQLALLRPTRTGLLHGEEEQSPATMRVYYTPLAEEGAKPDLIAAQVQPQVVLLDRRYLIFTIDDAEKDGGMWIHGPMP